MGKREILCSFYRPLINWSVALLTVYLTGMFSFWRASTFFLYSRSRSSLIRLSIIATSILRLFRSSFCCWSLEFCSWLSLLRIFNNKQTKKIPLVRTVLVLSLGKLVFNTVLKNPKQLGSTTCSGVSNLRFHTSCQVSICNHEQLLEQNSEKIS